MPTVTSQQTASPTSRTRRDIQALRALAVGLVLLYHLWPSRMSGGFIGVDVFYVISGFLITTHLIKRPVTKWSELTNFWARRIRRLIPAACLVLIISAIGIWFFVPTTMFNQIGRELLASGLYFQNWELAVSATDYLAADGAATPFQHYWSLSIEEQFYIIWPVFFAGMFLLNKKSGSMKTYMTGLSLVFVFSLLYSAYMVQNNPQAAYFVSPARFWELALGGITACVVLMGLRIPARLKGATASIGLAAIVWAGFFYSGSTPFPGWAALVPTLGTALVIIANTDESTWKLRHVLSMSFIQKMGNYSYSIYLWHWPLIIIAPYIKGSWITWSEKLIILAITGALSYLSFTYVEEHFRALPVLQERTSRNFTFLVALLIPVVACSMILKAEYETQITHGDQQLNQAKSENLACFGAAAALNPECDLVGDDLAMTPEFASNDKSVLYADGCWNGQPYTDRKICSYGDADSDTKIALLGNSHAGHWFPAIEPTIEEENWKLDTFLVSQCYTIDLPLAINPESDSKTCQEWNRWALDSITESDYDLVIMSNRSFLQISGVAPEDKPEIARQAYGETLAQFTSRDIRVLVLRDTPAAARNVPDCLAEHPDDFMACATPSSKAVENDPLADAGEEDQSGLVTVRDVNDLVCKDDQCLPVIGNLIVYFDHGHLSQTFAETLRPLIRHYIDEALAA